MELDPVLLQTALSVALQDTDLQAALATLEMDEAAMSSELTAAVVDAAEEIVSAASEELTELAAADAELAGAERAASAASVPSDPIIRLRQQVAEFQDMQDRLVEEERAERGRIEAYRTEREVRRARASAGMAPADEAATAPPAPAKGWWLRKRDESLDSDLEYQGQLERLRDKKKAISDVVTAKKRLSMQLSRLEQAAMGGAVADPATATELESARTRVKAARARAERALVERGVLPLCRQWVNERRQLRRTERYRPDLTGATAGGLAELPNRRQRIDTAAQKRLERLLTHLPGGSIGISGPRGAGKTTLLRAFCGPDRVFGAPDAPGLAILVSAPVKFAPLEFILDVFEQACRAVAPDDAEIEPLRPIDPDERPGAAWAVTAACLMCALLGAAAVAGGVVLVVHGVDTAALGDDANRLLLVGAMVTTAAAVIARGLGKHANALAWLAVAIICMYATVVAAATSDLGPWDLGEQRAVAYCAVAAAAVGTLVRFGTGASLRIWIRPASGAVALVIAAIVVLSMVIDRRTSDAFTMGVLLFAAVLVVASLVARPGPSHLWDDVPSPGPPSFRRHALSVAAWTSHAAVIEIAVVLAYVAAGLMLLGWYQRTPSSTVIGGIVLAAAGAILARYGQHARRTLDDWRIERANAAAHAEERGSLARDPYARTLMLRGREERGMRPAPREASAVRELAAYGPDAHPIADPALRAMLMDLVHAAARTHLRRIRYQQGFTSTWGTKLAIPGALKLPLSAEASSTGGQSSTEQLMTLPEAVRLLRTFLEDAADAAGGFMLGIDELDKIGSPEDAERFLNEIKAILGIPGCYFLISVSEDAVASFERRGMPFRDALDSTFDDVIRIDHFTFAGTHALLKSRTLDMPVPFVALCHCLAGGLPRDVIRIARRLFELRDAAGVSALGALCSQLLAIELKARRDGTVTALGRLRAEADTADVLAWLGRSQAPDPTLSSMQAAWPMQKPGAPVDAGAMTVSRLTREFAAFWYLSATLADFFTDLRTMADLELAEDASGADGIEQLALARQAFAVEPQLVWDRVSAFRDAWNLPVPMLRQFGTADAAPDLPRARPRAVT